jgi:hypothetical protein
MVVLAGWQLYAWGLIERAAVSLFPGGELVPLTVIQTGGPVASGSPLIVSTSMDVVREEVGLVIARRPLRRPGA